MTYYIILSIIFFIFLEIFIVCIFLIQRVESYTKKVVLFTKCSGNFETLRTYCVHSRSGTASRGNARKTRQPYKIVF